MKYKVTLEVETKLEPALAKSQLNDLFQLFSEVCLPPLKFRSIEIENIGTPSIADLIAAQEQWIKDHGGDESGYIDNYGPDRREYGAAIYAADCGELDRLKCL